LASLGRSPHKRGSGKRRNSEELAKTSFENVIRRKQSSINRIRPKSFQAPETPKATSFFYLANRYASLDLDPKIKPACSLPSLVGDQVKLSPDDDRPFLDPIPRRNKSRSLIGQATPLGMFPERNCISLKDLTVADSSWLRHRHRMFESTDDISKESHHQKHHYQSPTASSSSIGSSALNDITSKPLPPEPGDSNLEDNRPKLAPKPLLHTLGPNSMMSQLLAGKNMHLTRPPLISQKPVVPPRSSSKNNVSKKLIEDQRSRQTPSLLSEHYRCAIPFGRLRHHTSFESINEESEQASTPKDEVAKLPGSDYDHRRSRSEPHERILQSDRSRLTFPSRQSNELTVDLATEAENSCVESNSPTESDLPIQMAYDEKVRTLTYNSRASSLQSLTSIASSTRSTASSKHEQANLRRAVMNVHGQGTNDLSYEVNALLYEIRPRNKHGLCYGILEDSTQGWYPAESVEPYYTDQQF